MDTTTTTTTMTEEREDKYTHPPPPPTHSLSLSLSLSLAHTHTHTYIHTTYNNSCFFTEKKDNTDTTDQHPDTHTNTHRGFTLFSFYLKRNGNKGGCVSYTVALPFYIKKVYLKAKKKKKKKNYGNSNIIFHHANKI